MRSLGLVALMMSGCTWISQGDIDARRADLDDDGDGYIASEDTLTINSPPLSGSQAGVNNAVEVIVDRPVPSFPKRSAIVQ